MAGGCRKKDDPVNTQSGLLRVSFSHFAGNQPLSLNEAWHLNENGDSIKIHTYKYYVSNVKFITDSGMVYNEPESYHLIDEEVVSSKSFVVDGVPAGNYTKISFLIGVDEERNTSGAQTGALDPGLGMFWDWNSGYIMARMEGFSPSSQFDFAYHLGGFNGKNSVLRSVTLDFPVSSQVNGSTGMRNIHIKGDVLEWFKTPNLIKINEVNIVVGIGKDAADLADNYADMFTIDHID